MTLDDLRAAAERVLSPMAFNVSEDDRALATFVRDALASRVIGVRVEYTCTRNGPPFDMSATFDSRTDNERSAREFADRLGNVENRKCCTLKRFVYELGVEVEVP